MADSTRGPLAILKRPEVSVSEKLFRPRFKPTSVSSKKPPQMDLLAKEEEYKRLNAEIEAKTAELVRQAEKVIKEQNEVLSNPICSVYSDLQNSWKYKPASKQPTAEDTKNKKYTGKSTKMSSPGLSNKQKVQKVSQKDDDFSLPEDTGNFSLAKTISIIEERVSDDLIEEDLQDDIMPGDEMSAEAQIRFLKANLRILQEEFDRLSHEYHKKEDENSTFIKNMKDLEEERARLQRTTNAQQTQIEKQKALAEEFSKQCEGLKQQVAALYKELEGMRRIQKQAASAHNATEVRLNRAVEEVERTKTQLAKLKLSNKDLTSQDHQKIEGLQAENRKLERQKSELIVAFKKQLKLIDILKRQKMHFEAAKMLSFTEEEFLKVLDWGSNGV